MDDAIKRIALAIQQGRGNQNLPLPVTARVSQPSLPPFQIPGMNASGIADSLGPPLMSKPSPAATPAAPAQPSPGLSGLTPEDKVLHDQALNAALNGAVGASPTPPPLAPPQAIGAAPGMVQPPQTDDQLAAWRQLMDQLQIARQGA